MWLKLAAYWKAIDTSTKWQLIIFDAVARSKLMYGLETAALTEALQKKIDAFQRRGLRQILTLKHPYYDRENANFRIYKTAPETVAPDGSRKVRPFSEYHYKCKQNILDMFSGLKMITH